MIKSVYTNKPDTRPRLSATMFRSEVWSNVLIPHLWDDEVVTKLWMSTPNIQTLITQRLLSLMITVRRTGRSSEDGKDQYYTRPPFLSALGVLQYLWIIVPLHLGILDIVKGAGGIPNIICSFPVSLRFLDTNNISMLNDGFNGSQVASVPLHLVSWLSSRGDITLGPTLSKQLNTCNKLLLSYLWDTALVCIKDQKYILPGDAHLLRHLTRFTNEVAMQLRTLADTLWDSVIFTSLAEQITDCVVRITDPNDAEWLSKHFPNLIHLSGWSPILPPHLRTFSCLNIPNLTTAMVMPLLPSSLTKISLGIGRGISWPSQWPGQLKELYVDTFLDECLDDFRSHIRSLPVLLERFSYNLRGTMGDDWWDVKTMRALPRRLRILMVPDLPNGWTSDEMAVLAELPKHLTEIDTSQDRIWSESWRQTLSTAAWEILPAGLTSLDISSREVVYPVGPDNTLVWNSTEVRDVSALIARFPNVTHLTVYLKSLEDPLPVFPDSVKSISIDYHDGVWDPNTPHNISLYGVVWPSQLEKLRVGCYDLVGDGLVNIVGRSLECVPDTLSTLALHIYNGKLITFPKKWPKKLVVMAIDTNNVQRLVDGVINVIEHNKEHLPNTGRVCITVNNQRVHYQPDTCTLSLIPK